MKRRQQHPSVASPTRLAPLAQPSPSPDDRCERDDSPSRADDAIAVAIASAAARSPPKKYPRLKTLPYLAQQHVAAMHNGDFVARSRLRWTASSSATESDAAHAHRVSRESAALVLQSAWRRSAAVRLRARLVRRIWQQQMELAAWLSRGREQLQSLLETLATSPRPLMGLANRLEYQQTTLLHLTHLKGSNYTLPGLLLGTWLCFVLGIRRRSRFLRRPAPAILHTVHIPVRNTCRLLGRLWREVTRLALSAIQCRARSYLARCKYWRLLTAHRKTQAAIRLQAVYRAWLSRRLVWRLRRRRAAIRLQCVWRCYRARCRVKQQRITQCARRFFTGVAIQAVERASQLIVQHAARQIQRLYRGQCARARFRVLVAARQQREWHRNPSKGYRLFSRRMYVQAAVYFERCFRQGIFEGGSKAQQSDEGMSPSQQDDSKRHRKLEYGSALSFSFSEAPLTHVDGRGGGLYRRPATAGEEKVVIASASEMQRQFWQSYALSHWLSYQSNGDPLHLCQARVGFETYLRIDAESDSTFHGIRSLAVDGRLQFLRFHARYCLSLSIYWTSERSMGTNDESALALSQCIEVMDALEVSSGLTTVEMVSEAKKWYAHLAMTSATLYLKEREYDACYAQLQTLLMIVKKDSASPFEELEIQFLMALVLLQQQSSSAASNPQAEVHLQRCYQIVELWPAVGFYHGVLDSNSAAKRLQQEPVGSFLLHHEAVEGEERDPVSAPKFLLKVKLSDDPCKVSSLRIYCEDGLYHMKKLPNVSHFSVHELIQQLPKAAGIKWANGVRRDLYVPALEKKLSETEKIRPARRRLLLPWEHWHWRLSGPRTRRNECWSALCHLVSVRFEASDAFAMAAFVARDGLVTARSRELRAGLFFTLGRVLSSLHRRVDSALAMQQAAIESARLPVAFDRNFKAVTRAIRSATGGAQNESFAVQLERVSKLERMCVKAWSYDSCSPLLRGHPFCEALLLQRIDDEMCQSGGNDIADTFFLRSLLRAHMKAFLSREIHEIKHVELALTCAQRLFDRFYHSGSSHTVSDDSRGGAVGVLTCARHVSGFHRGKSSHDKDFNLPLLLLTWHRMPFQVTFEMAEVMYRWPYMGCDAIIDVYESLYGRLRSVKPRQWTYAAHEELLLVRLAFMYAQRSTDCRDVAASHASMRKAVELLDELIATRTLRSLAAQRTPTKVKRIQWPTANVRLPLGFSREELVFVRGFLSEHMNSSVSDKTSKRSQQEAVSKAWNDYDELHRALLALVLSEQQQERENGTVAKRLKGVRVFVGDTKHLDISDVLHSKPYVVIQCEGKQSSTQQAATWMNQLSPGWSEHVEMDLTSAKARLMVVVMNRQTRLRARQANGGADQVLGYVQVFVEELLLVAAGSASQPQWYDLVCRENEEFGNKQRPRIRLSFQLLMQAKVRHSDQEKHERRRKKMRGNWDVNELKDHLRGDLTQFVKSSWIWRWFGRQWLADKEFCIAAWFLQRAVQTSSGSSQTNSETLAHAMDLVGLATCYQARMGHAWLEIARPHLEQALSIFQETYEASGASDLALWKQIQTIHQRLTAGNDAAKMPLASELARNIPASSRWIAIQRRGSGDAGPRSVYYFNEDTCERFFGVDGEPNIQVPLEWEDGEQIVNPSRDLLRPRRVVVLTTEMKARVAFHCQRQRELHCQDPLQWVAVFNPRKSVMQFLSLDESDSTLQMTTVQPTAYAMEADEGLMYHVLVVQDAFRKFQVRRTRQRLVRGLLRSGCCLIQCLVASRVRLLERAELERKKRLNSISVLVEKASGLRAMDLLTSDPFVTIELLDGEGHIVAKGETSVKRNTLNPRWHEEFSLHYAFADHAARLPHAQTPQIRFQIHDHDIMASFNQDEDEATKEIVTKWIDGSNERIEGVKRKTEATKNDFLGLVVVEIEPLVDGRRVSADLTLLDKDGYDSPRSRGTLTLTLQWVHDAELTIKARRNAVKPMLLVHPRRRPRPKPSWTAEWREQLEDVKRKRAALLTRMADCGVLLDQLVRLYKRWKVAEASGRTADEAKLLEQRLLATVATPQQFQVKQEALLTSGSEAQNAVVSLCDLIHIPIDDYIESCEKNAAAQLKASFMRTWSELQDAKIPSLGEIQGFEKGVQGFVGRMRRLLSLQLTVVTWRTALLDVAASFMEAASPPLVWLESSDAMATLAQFEKISATLEDAVGGPRPVTPAKVTTGSATSTVSVQSTGSSNVGNPPTTPTPSAAVAKRMERIERERKKAVKRK